MLKTTIQAIVLSVFLMSLTVSAFADSTSDARKAITAIYQQQATALEHKNLDGVFSHLAPGYVSVSLHGQKTTVADARKTMTPVLVASKSVHASVNVLNFSLKGNVAQATVKESLTILIVDARTKKMITLVDTNVSKDNWIKTPSAWLQTHGQEISDITTVNGKPVPSQ